jgi:anti-sigma B factor antagonist
MPLPPEEFSVDVLRHPGGIVVAPRGDVDLATVGEVRAACAAPEGTLVLDLRGVDFLDTSGLNLVLECQRRAESDGSRFAVVRGPAEVQRLFEILGLNHRLGFVDDPAEALSHAQPGA